MTVSNKPGHRGEHEGSRKTIARGMPGLLRCTCGDYARVLTSHFAREAVGALGTRHSLRPLFSLGGWILQKLGRIAPRDRGCISAITAGMDDLCRFGLISSCNARQNRLAQKFRTFQPV